MSNAPRSASVLRWRPRLTLRTSFIWLTCITLIASHAFVSYTTYQLRRENERLKHQSGLPIVTDKQRLAAGSLALPADLQWRFRVYKPANRTVVLKVAYHNIDWAGLPTANETLRISQQPEAAHEIVLDLAVVERQGRRVLLLGVSRDGMTMTQTLTIPDLHQLHRTHLGRKASSCTLNESSRSAESGLPGRPFILLRYALRREDAPAGVSMTSHYPANDGLMVWLEDAPP